ncbi:MAG: winged helix DNA-binding protein [Pseudomonadota bacterium]
MTSAELMADNPTKAVFLDCLQLIERLHRRLLDVIKVRLDERGRTDINPVQALLLFNVGDLEVTAGELKSRGYYLGSNVSYNLKKLVELGYMIHRKSEHDRRSVRISLSDKGHAICHLVSELYDEQLELGLEQAAFDEADLGEIRRMLREVERFWATQLRYAL